MSDANSVPEGPLLQVESLGVSYGRIAALDPLSFEVRGGGLVFVLGPNGAGKSSLVRALAGLVPIRHGGRVVLAGKDVTHVPAYRRVRTGISLVPEGRGTLRGLSVGDNLDIGWHAAAPQRRGARHADLDVVFELFPVLRERLAQDCSTLSGGEMQMLAIARAILAKPRVLLLDEPSLGLAPMAIARVYDALTQLNREGLAMVLIEQKAVPLTETPDLTLVLQSGHLVYESRDKRPTEAELAELYLGRASVDL